MTESLILALLAGVALGVAFFLGLWWTVSKGLEANNPAVWFLVSFLLRMLMASLGFYWIAQFGRWQYLCMALVGFVMTRMILTRFFSKDGITGAAALSNKRSESAETKHAP
jgi:F1F0 ATPase subunit 2